VLTFQRGGDQKGRRDEVAVGDGGEILVRVVAWVLEQKRRVADHVVEEVEDRVAVGRGLRAGASGERAARAGAILDDHRLTQHLVEFLHHRP
jgi:hypothetical protein